MVTFLRPFRVAGSGSAASSPRTAVGVSTPAGTRPGRLRRHCVIGQVEYRWPISCGEEPGGVLEDEDLLALLGGGDLRDRARDLAMTVPAAELRDAFQLAAGCPDGPTASARPSVTRLVRQRPRRGVSAPGGA